MLDLMIDTIKKFPAKAPEETQVVARGLTSLMQKGDELSLSAQVQLSIFLFYKKNLNQNSNNLKYLYALCTAQFFYGTVFCFVTEGPKRCSITGG